MSNILKLNEQRKGELWSLCQEVMRSILKFGERVPKTPLFPKGWKEIYTFHKGMQTNDSLLGHKSILFFPGDGVSHDDEMNGCCKLIEIMLKNATPPLKEKPHLYSLGFDTDTISHRRQLLEQEGLTRYGLEKNKRFLTYWHPFFEVYILPLIQTKSGMPRPLNEAMKNLQNITIVSHCHGSMFAQQIENLLYEKVKQFYPNAEKQVMANLRMLHLASRKPLGKKTGAKHFHIVSLSDDMYVDRGTIADDNFYKMLHHQKMDSRTALVPLTENEIVGVFKEMAPPPTDGEEYDEHSQMFHLVAGQKKHLSSDPDMRENEAGFQFVRNVLRHFVASPEDPASLKEIMKKVNPAFAAKNLNDGQRLNFKIQKEKQENKSLLDLLAKYSLEGVSGESNFYLQKMEDGTYFYQRIKEAAHQSGDFTSYKALLKHVRGKISDSEKKEEALKALKRKDWPMVHLLTQYMLSQDLTDLLIAAQPDDLPHLSQQMKWARLSPTQHKDLLASLTAKARKIKNSTGRIKVQSFLEKRKKIRVIRLSKDKQKT